MGGKWLQACLSSARVSHSFGPRFDSNQRCSSFSSLACKLSGFGVCCFWLSTKQIPREYEHLFSFDQSEPLEPKPPSSPPPSPSSPPTHPLYAIRTEFKKRYNPRPQNVGVGKVQRMHIYMHVEEQQLILQ